MAADYQEIIVVQIVGRLPGGYSSNLYILASFCVVGYESPMTQRHSRRGYRYTHMSLFGAPLRGTRCGFDPNGQAASSIDPSFMLFCFCCNTKFQFGQHIYDGRWIAKYGIAVCSVCYQSNWDGWAPLYESRLISHLYEEGLPVPERNEKGWLPRD